MRCGAGGRARAPVLRAIPRCGCFLAAFVAGRIGAAGETSATGVGGSASRSVRCGAGGKARTPVLRAIPRCGWFFAAFVAGGVGAVGLPSAGCCVACFDVGEPPRIGRRAGALASPGAAELAGLFGSFRVARDMAWLFVGSGRVVYARTYRGRARNCLPPSLLR